MIKACDFGGGQWSSWSGMETYSRDGGKKSSPGEGNGELLATDLNPVEHQFVPQTVVTYNPASELRLLSPDGVVKQSPSQRRGHRAQDLYRKQAKWTKTGPRLQLSTHFTEFVVGFCFSVFLLPQKPCISSYAMILNDCNKLKGEVYFFYVLRKT